MVLSFGLREASALHVNLASCTDKLPQNVSRLADGTRFVCCLNEIIIDSYFVKS
jgi:hypothetical protein